jgi:uncharacterized membrane protein YciS (DUF1049 family)
VRTVKIIIFVVLATLAIIVMVQNAQPITFRFLNWNYQVSQLLLVAIVLVLGFLAGFVTAYVPRRKRTSPDEA